MKIEVHGDSYKVTINNDYKFGGFSNPLDVKKMLLQMIDKEFDDEITNLLNKGTVKEGN